MDKSKVPHLLLAHPVYSILLSSYRSLYGTDGWPM